MIEDEDVLKQSLVGGLLFGNSWLEIVYAARSGKVLELSGVQAFEFRGTAAPTLHAPVGRENIGMAERELKA